MLEKRVVSVKQAVALLSADPFRFMEYRQDEYKMKSESDEDFVLKVDKAVFDEFIKNNKMLSKNIRIYCSEPYQRKDGPPKKKKKD